MAERMNELTGKEWLQNSFSIWRDLIKDPDERSLKHPASFPKVLVEKLIRIYLKGEHKQILDPFLGVGTTLLAAKALGHRGMGVDLNPEYCEISSKRIEAAPAVNGAEIKIVNDDSRELLKHIEPESVDLVVTSPPYWDILNRNRTADKREVSNYSDSESDLGNIADYEEFLDDLKAVFTQVYVSMKPNTSIF